VNHRSPPAATGEDGESRGQGILWLVSRCDGQEKRLEHCSSLAHALCGFPRSLMQLWGSLLVHAVGPLFCFDSWLRDHFPERFSIIPNCQSFVKGFSGFFGAVFTPSRLPCPPTFPQAWLLYPMGSLPVKGFCRQF